jgi:hypothetical protein
MIVVEEVYNSKTGEVTQREHRYTLLWTDVRQERDILLEQSDVFMIPDRPLTDIQREELLSYRKSLRDLPNSFQSADDAMSNLPTIPSWMLINAS